MYSDDFETPTDPLVGWSDGKVVTSPNGSHRFLGEFGNEEVTLHLCALPPHTTATLALDLFIIRSWDGNHQPPDIFEITVDNQRTLLRTTFSNYVPAAQAYPHPFPGGQHVRGTGACARNELGYTFNGGIDSVWGDSTYKLTFEFPHSANELTVSFRATLDSPIENERWGLDNVHVMLDTPEGGSCCIGGTCRDEMDVHGCILACGEWLTEPCSPGSCRRLDHLEIVGPSLVLEQSATQYECRAHYSDGTTRSVAPSWTVQPPNQSYANASAGGVLTALEAPPDPWIQLVATHTEGPVTKVARRRIWIRKALPDLAGYSFYAPQNLVWGKKVEVQFSVRNSGEGDAPDSKVGYYLKDDAGHRFDFHGAVSDVQGIGAARVSRGYYRRLLLPCAPPNGLPASGSLTIGMVIDSDGAVPESNETNNRDAAEGVDYVRRDISTPSTCFVKGVVFDPRIPPWTEDKAQTIQQLKDLHVDSARFWMNMCVVMRGVPEAWRHKTPGDVNWREIADCANDEGEFAEWVDWSTYDDVIETLYSNGIYPVPLICDGSATPVFYLEGEELRVSPDEINEQCSTDPSSDCGGVSRDMRRQYKGIGKQGYLALVRLFAGAAAKRYSTGNKQVEMWNLENEPNWFPFHVLVPKWRCGETWLDPEFPGSLLATMLQAVQDGNPSAKTTINWNASVPARLPSAVESLSLLRPYSDAYRLVLRRAGVLELWDNYFRLPELAIRVKPWQEELLAWTRRADVQLGQHIIGLGLYPNYLFSSPLGGAYVHDTVAQAYDIERLVNSEDPNPVWVLETGYPSYPDDGGFTRVREYTLELQEQYIREAYAGAVDAGAKGFYVFRLEDLEEDPKVHKDFTEVEPHFGLVYTNRQAKPAFNAYASLIGAGATASSVQGLPVQELGAVTGSLLDSEQERVLATTAAVLGVAAQAEMLTTTFWSDRVNFPITLRIGWGGGGVVVQLLNPIGDLYYQATGELSPLERRLRLPSEGEWQVLVRGVDTSALGEPVLAVVSTDKFAPLDFDRNGTVDKADFEHFRACLNGPDRLSARPDCDDADLELDADVDLRDIGAFQTLFGE